MNLLLWILLVGVGATLVMDAWALLLRHIFGIPSLGYALVGRWVGHMPHGRFTHEHIGKAEPVVGEAPLGSGRRRSSARLELALCDGYHLCGAAPTPRRSGLDGRSDPRPRARCRARHRRRAIPCHATRLRLRNRGVQNAGGERCAPQEPRDASRLRPRPLFCGPCDVESG